MGKIRVKTLGDESAEKEQKKEAKRRQEDKKSRVETEVEVKKTEEVKAKKAEDEESSIKAEAAPVEEQKVEPAHNASLPASQEQRGSQGASVAGGEKPKSAKGGSRSAGKKEKFQKQAKRSRSQKYQSVASLVDKKKIYSLTEALELLPKLKISSFDETVELHINTIEGGISGQVVLPHGTGKKIRVAIADDALIAAVEKGTIDFDVLIAEPSFMPRLAKVARFLGPRGLMPNPKNGTISPKPEEVAKKFEGGLVNFKTEAKAPIMHLIVGKLSFGEKKLSENIKTLINALPELKVKNATLKSTMSPAIKLDILSI